MRRFCCLSVPSTVGSAAAPPPVTIVCYCCQTDWPARLWCPNAMFMRVAAVFESAPPFFVRINSLKKAPFGAHRLSFRVDHSVSLRLLLGILRVLLRW